MIDRLWCTICWVVKFRHDWNEIRKRAKILICASVKRTHYLVQSWCEKQRWNENKVKLKLSSRVWRYFELTSHHVAGKRGLRHYRYETRNKVNNRITFISTICTHRLKECSSIRQHQKRTRKQKRFETKANRTSSSPSLIEKWSLGQRRIQTAKSWWEDSDLPWNRISQSNIPCTIKYWFNGN